MGVLLGRLRQWRGRKLAVPAAAGLERRRAAILAEETRWRRSGSGEMTGAFIRPRQDPMERYARNTQA
jgi:hypothetical protein